MNKMPYRHTWNNMIIIQDTLHNPKIQCFDTHSHNEYEFLFLHKGDVTEVIEGRKYKLKKLDLILIRPNNYHFIQFDSQEDYERTVLMFNPEELQIDNIDLLSSQNELWHCRHAPTIIELFKRIDYYAAVMPEELFRRMLPLLIKELIFNLSIINKQTVPTENIHPTITRALEEINQNLFTIKHISQIAERLFVTESYLHRLFKQELKTTPHKYITEKRLHIARSMILQGQHPTHVCQECGFNDYTSFYRSYYKQFGHAPSATK